MANVPPRLQGAGTQLEIDGFRAAVQETKECADRLAMDVGMLQARCIALLVAIEKIGSPKDLFWHDDIILSAAEARWVLKCNNNFFRKRIIPELVKEGLAERTDRGKRYAWQIGLASLKAYISKNSAQEDACKFRMRSDIELKSYLEKKRRI